MPLRIGLFTEIYHPVVNGVVASVDALASGLRSRGHEVYCFAPKMAGEPETQPGERAVVRIPSLPLPARTPYRLTLPLVARREVRSMIAGLDVIHAHSPFVTGWMGLRYARRYGLPLVYTYHTQLEAYAHYIPFEPKATRFAASQLTRSFANHADAVIAPTPAMATRLRALGVTVRIEIVPSGIDVAAFGAGRRRSDLRARLGAGEGDRVLLYVGRLAREKNVGILLDAVAQADLCGVRLVIAGEGPTAGELAERARALGIAERTLFLGVVARGRLPDLYASADAFVMPSTTETQGLVLAEALAAGSWVIAADAPQNRDVLGGAGVLVAPDPRSFAAAFRAVAGARPEAAEVARGVAERFSIDRHVEKIVGLYQSLRHPARIA